MSSHNDHPYASFLHKVEKPARYVGGEYNQVVKDPASVRVQLALAFPDLYDLGMSHMGTKILYSLINRQSDMLCERAFAPWPDMEEQLRAHGLPILSCETHRSLAEFDAVGFSLQYELTFTNVLNILDLCGIPLRAADRTQAHPLILAGGPVATQPEAMAPFIDVFLIGDAEEKLPELLRKLADCRDARLARRDTLIELAKLGGLYCPALYATAIDPRSGFEVVTGPASELMAAGVPERPQRVILQDINRFPFPDDSPVAAAEAIFDRMSVEIARGCTEGCRFCQAGMIYRPVRERDPEQIVSTLVSAIEKGGYDEASLTTLSTADYSCISPLIKKVMEKLRPQKVSLGIASLRAYGVDEDTLDEIASVRATGLTFAPEAGTQRMRDVINKNITEEDLTRTAHRVFARGWDRMKMYFMIGLPTETDEDVQGIMELGHRMKEIGRSYHGRRADITVSVSSHVPKPHTPFQWVAMDTLQEIERKQDVLLDAARRYRLEFRRHDARTSFLECVIGRGDRRVADVVERAWRNGARFDGWDERLNWGAWVQAIAASGLDPQLYLGTIPTDARLPWDHLDMQLEPRFLLRDYRMAMKDRLAPPCGKPVGAQVHHTNLQEHEADRRKYVCYNCGVACDLSQMRAERAEFLTKLGAVTQTSLNSDEARTERERIQARVENGSAPHDFQQGEPVRVQLQFTKLGVAALTGHLDLVRQLPRVLRRAGLPVYYTEGFHPKPAIVFGPALPLGVESLGELVEVKLTALRAVASAASGTAPEAEVPAVRAEALAAAPAEVLAATRAEVLAAALRPDDILRRLNAVSEAGIEFTACRIVQRGDPGLGKTTSHAGYIVKLPRYGESDLAWLREHLAAFAAAASVPIEIERKQRVKSVDLKTVVEELRLAGDDDRARLAQLAPAVAGALPPVALHLWLRLDAEAQVRPEEVLRAAIDPALRVEPTDLVRLGMRSRGLRGDEDVGQRTALALDSAAGRQADPEILVA
jgi:radical SAM family uncharacterized protein